MKCRIVDADGFPLTVWEEVEDVAAMELDKTWLKGKLPYRVEELSGLKLRAYDELSKYYVEDLDDVVDWLGQNLGMYDDAGTDDFDADDYRKLVRETAVKHWEPVNPIEVEPAKPTFRQVCKMVAERYIQWIEEIPDPEFKDELKEITKSVRSDFASVTTASELLQVLDGLGYDRSDEALDFILCAITKDYGRKVEDYNQPTDEAQ